MNRAIHRVVGFGRVAVILGWAAFLAFAWYTTAYPQPGKPGRLGIINPSYRWLSLASAAALVLVGGALLPAQRTEHAHGPESGHPEGEDSHDHEEEETASPGELVFQALFLAPVVLSLCTSGSGLSGTSLSRRGVHEIRLPEQPGIRSATPAAPMRPLSAELEQGQPLSMADLYDYLLIGASPELLGRQVDVIGQYFVDERCGENQFLVTRIVVTCCLADAEVIGLRAQSSKPFKPSASGPATRASKLGPWIRVRGKLRRLNDRFGNPALFIDDAAISEVPAPADILLYPRRRTTPW
jgi:uncharacterized repeat protein (TIGR03943 family)